MEPQKERLKHIWGEKFLDYEEVDATDKIKQGRWKLSDEDRDEVINAFFKTDYKWVIKTLSDLPDKFVEAIKIGLEIKSSNIDSDYMPRIRAVFPKDSVFDIRKMTVGQISCLNRSIFKAINASETKATSRVAKDEYGRPKRDASDNIVKEPKEAGEISWSTNYGNIRTFISNFNSAFPESRVPEDLFGDRRFSNITNMVDDNDTCIDFDLFGNHEIYAMINHNAVDIMNMSVSKFYKSCQELYFGGGHGDQYMKSLLINVFDPNTIPAFLSLNTPYYNISTKYGSVEKLSDMIPMCRLLIRNIEPFAGEGKSTLFFDKTYPDRMDEVLWKMISKYSGNIQENGRHNGYYYFSPDVHIDDYSTLNDNPYMDKLKVARGTRIGRNFKKLHLTSNIDWTSLIIDKNANIEELTIETDEVPEDLFKLKISPKFIKFKYVSIKDIKVFSGFKTDSIYLYQCKLNETFLSDLYSIMPNLKVLSLGSVVVGNFNDILKFESLEELELIYTLSSKIELESVVPKSIKKLVISGDLLGTVKNKSFINNLKRNKVNVELKGLVL
jgi:hypothetical protein